jgi:hypothetical protein
LSNKKRQLVFAGIAELAELDAGHFGARGWSEMLELRAIDEKILKSWICIFSMIDMSEGLPRRILLAVVPGRKVVRVLAPC